MKLPKKRRRVVAVEQPRRVRRMGQGSIGGHGDNGSGLHRRVNAIKGGGGGGGSHNQTNHSGHGGNYRLPNAPHDKMGKVFFACSQGITSKM